MDLPFYFQFEKEVFYETFTIKTRKHVCVELHRRKTSMRRHEQEDAEQDQVICEVLQVVFMLLGTANHKHWISPWKRNLKIIHFLLMGMFNLHKKNNLNFDFFEFNVEYRGKTLPSKLKPILKRKYKSMQFQKLCQDYLNYPSWIFEIKLWW